MHKSAGAIIKDGDKILMLDRVNPPFGWACPAGHVDGGENPQQAMIREVKEETGLDVGRYKLLINEFVEWNECKSGEKGHDWYLYEVLDWKGNINENERERKNIGWFAAGEIKKLKLEKVWKYWFEKLKII